MKSQISFFLVVAACISLTAVSTGRGSTVTFHGTTQANDVPLLSNGGGGNANANYGTAALLDVGAFSGGLRESLLRFNITSVAGEVVTNASLQLTVSSAGFGTYTNQAVNLYAVSAANANWVEGTGGGLGDPSTAQNGNATWNQLIKGSPGTSWAGSAGLRTPTTDYAATPVGSVTVSNTTASGTRLTATFSNLAFL